MIMRSSEVIARALGWPEKAPAEVMGWKAKSSIAQASGHCALCGTLIAEGDVQISSNLSSSFTDDLSMAVRGSPHICGWCAPFLTTEGLLKTQRGAFGRDGDRPFSKWADIASALTVPPEPPFVFIFATSKNQHLAWRAPVNLSPDLYDVRVGLRDLRIRRPILLQAIEIGQRLAEAVKDTAGAKAKAAKASDDTKAKTLANPFVSLSPDLKDAQHARLKEKVVAAALENNLAAELTFMRGLTLGETWALRFVLTPNAGKDAGVNQEIL